MLISKEGVKSIIDNLIDLNYQCYLLNDDDVDIRMLSKYIQKKNTALYEYFNCNFFGEDQIDYVYRKLSAHAHIFNINNKSNYLSYRNRVARWMSGHANYVIRENTGGMEEDIFKCLIDILRSIEIIYSKLCFNIVMYTFSPIYENCDDIRQALYKTFRDDNILRTLYVIVGGYFGEETEIERFILELRQESTKIFSASDYAVPLCDILEQTLRDICLHTPILK